MAGKKMQSKKVEQKSWVSLCHHWISHSRRLTKPALWITNLAMVKSVKHGLDCWLCWFS